RQAVAIFLAGPELGGGWFYQDIFGDDGRTAVDIAGKGIYLSFVYVAEHAEAAGHVSIEGAVAGGELAFIGGIEHHVAEFIGESHDDVAPGAALEVLFGESEREVAEGRPERMQEGFIDFADGDDIIRVAEVAGELFGIAYGMGGGVGRREQDCANVCAAQCFAGQGERYGAIDAAAAGDD